MSRLSQEELKTYGAFASRLLDGAAEISLRYFGNHGAVDTKSDDSIVTIADREIEAFIRSQIEVAYPDHGIIGEEQGEKETDSAYQWIIDPIDGTKAFAAGYPTFCTLIGLLMDGEPVLGAVDQPVLKRRWASNNFSPASLQMGGGIATTSIDYMSDAQLAALKQFKQQHHLQLLYGGDAYAYMMLLDGTLDAVFDVALKPYDILPILPVLAQDNSIKLQYFNHGKATDKPTGDIVASRDSRLLEMLGQIVAQD